MSCSAGPRIVNHSGRDDAMATGRTRAFSVRFARLVTVNVARPWREGSRTSALLTGLTSKLPIRYRPRKNGSPSRSPPKLQVVRHVCWLFLVDDALDQLAIAFRAGGRLEADVERPLAGILGHGKAGHTGGHLEEAQQSLAGTAPFREVGGGGDQLPQPARPAGPRRRRPGIGSFVEKTLEVDPRRQVRDEAIGRLVRVEEAGDVLEDELGRSVQLIHDVEEVSQGVAGVGERVAKNGRQQPFDVSALHRR